MPKLNGTVVEKAIKSLGEAAWAPLSVFGVHVIAFVSNTYHHLPDFDIPMHFLGGVVIAFYFHRTVSNMLLENLINPYRTIAHRLFVFTCTCTVAVFWEFAEFVLDLWFGSRFVGGLDDTMGDLFWGVLGGLLFIIFSAFLTRSSVLFSVWRAQ
jgi:hypothetical protein